MRELGFSQLWPKLAKPRCTTFRFTRKDKDWQVGEVVRVVYKPRSKDNRSVLGQAVITAKEPRAVPLAFRDINMANIAASGVSPVTVVEAQADGFKNVKGMAIYIANRYPKNKDEFVIMNKLVLAWTQIWVFVPEQKPLVAAQWAAMLDASEHATVCGKIPQYITHICQLDEIHQEAAEEAFSKGGELCKP